MCANLLELDQNVFAAAFSDIMPFTMLVQAVFSHLMILNFGQSLTFALAFLYFFWASWFMIYQVITLRTPVSDNYYFVVSGVTSFAVLILLLLSAGLSFPSLLEAFTQQTFVSQALFRYPGIVVWHAANFLLVGMYFWLSNGNAGSLKIAKLSGFIFVGALAGMSHYLFAAIFSFIVVSANWSQLKQARLRPIWLLQKIPHLIGTLFGLSIGLAVSLFSGAAESRLAQFDEQYWTVEPSARLVAILLDPFWVLASLGTLAFVLGLILGFILERKFEIGTRLKIQIRPMISFFLSFLLFSILVSFLASLVSYSAPWHGITPRYFLVVFAVGLGVVIAGKCSRKIAKPGVMSSLAGLTVLAVSYALAFGWASSLPSSWAAGPLPIQTVKVGPGSGIIWQDTDKPASLECYRQIESRLSEKKTYLRD
jgi:hypothetical protein